MAHSLILGMTDSGKSTLAKMLASKAKRTGPRRVIVLDPTHDTWDADFQTADNEEFLTVFWSPHWLSCDVFIDEAGDAIGQYDKLMHRTATMGRKQGHNCYFISQRGKQLSPTVRSQCRNLFLFAMAREDTQELARNWNKPELENASLLPQGQCYYARRFGDVKLLTVFDSSEVQKNAPTNVAGADSSGNGTGDRVQSEKTGCGSGSGSGSGSEGESGQEKESQKESATAGV